MNKSSKIVGIVFLSISLLLVIGVMLTFWLGNQFDVINQPLVSSPTAYVTEDEASDWLTYIDQDFNFHIKYPNSWQFEVSDGFGIGTVPALRTVSFFKDSAEHGVTVTIFSADDYEVLVQQAVSSATNKYVLEDDLVFNFELDLEPEVTFTQELKEIYREIYEGMNESFTFVPFVEAESKCKPTGCSGQVCSDEEIVTTCEYSEAFVCYKNSVCERQANGSCGWTMDDALKSCLKDAAGIGNMVKLNE